MHRKYSRFVISMVVAVAAVMAITVNAQKPRLRQMEKLSRGVVAVNEGNGKVFVGWRMSRKDAMESTKRLCP